MHCLPSFFPSFLPSFFPSFLPFHLLSFLGRCPGPASCAPPSPTPPIIRASFCGGSSSARAPSLHAPRVSYRAGHQILAIDSIMALANTTSKCLFLRPKLQVWTLGCLIPVISDAERTRCLKEEGGRRGEERVRGRYEGGLE